MTESSKLCLSCGLCCDGTLIGHVQLETKELNAVSKVLNIEHEQDHGFFLQPCKKYCDGCSIYSERPTQCASFKCGLLNTFEQKEITFDATAEIIKEVKKQTEFINNQLSLLSLNLQSDSFFFKMAEIRNNFQKKQLTSPLTVSESALLLDISVLDKLIKKGFDVSFD
jgi:Fe-S-cluster containining protein